MRAGEKLEELFALVFRAEKAIVRPQIASGTHALALTLYGLLGRGDKLIYASGQPYDTLEEIIGASPEDKGSLRELGVEFEAVPCRKGAGIWPDREGLPGKATRGYRLSAFTRLYLPAQPVLRAAEKSL